jgi:hypothetical protein
MAVDLGIELHQERAPRPRVSASASTWPLRQKRSTWCADSRRAGHRPAAPACQATSAWNDSLGSARSQIWA